MRSWKGKWIRGHLWKISLSFWCALPAWCQFSSRAPRDVTPNKPGPGLTPLAPGIRSTGTDCAWSRAVSYPLRFSMGRTLPRPQLPGSLLPCSTVPQEGKAVALRMRWLCSELGWGGGCGTAAPPLCPLGGFPDPRCPIDPALQLPSAQVRKGALLLLQGGT